MIIEDKLPTYVAGATRNIERPQAFIALVKAHPLLSCTYDWVVDVLAEKAKGVEDTDLTDTLRTQYALNGVVGVEKAVVTVILAEAPMSSGQSVELGIAIECRRRSAPLYPKRIIVSGGNRKSIFTSRHERALIDYEVFDDNEAFEILVAIAQSQRDRDPRPLGSL